MAAKRGEFGMPTENGSLRKLADGGGDVTEGRLKLSLPLSRVECGRSVPVIGINALHYATRACRSDRERRPDCATRIAPSGLRRCRRWPRRRPRPRLLVPLRRTFP